MKILPSEITAKSIQFWTKSQASENRFLAELASSGLTDDKWEIFGNLLSCEKNFTRREDGFELSIHTFARFIRSNPSEELWEAYKDVISSYEIQEHRPLYIQRARNTISRFEIQNYAPSLITTNFARMQEAGITLEQVEKLQRIVNYYISRNFVLRQIIPEFADFICEKPDKEIWDFYVKQVDFCIRQRSILGVFTKDIADLLKKTKDKPEIQKIFFEATENQSTVETLFDSYNRVYTEGTSPMLLKALKKTICHYIPAGTGVENENALGTALRITESFKILNLPTTPQTIIENYNNGFNTRLRVSGENDIEFLFDTAAHAALCAIFRSDNAEVRDTAKEVIKSITHSDNVPYPLEDETGQVHPMAQRTYDEAMEVYQRIFDIYHGFTSLTWDTKKPPTKEHSLLVRFGADVASSKNDVRYINSSNPTAFPGNGFTISGINLAKVLTKDKEKEAEGRDPFEEYKISWPWAAKEFDDFAKTQIIFTRGFIAISCPKSSRYDLKDRLSGQKTNFSLIIYNDHHHNDNEHVAFLVPTQVLEKKLEGIAVPFENYKGYSADLPDINNVRFNYLNLVSQASLIPGNILNLGWGSNAGGGLCNAYRPRSQPFHEWEYESTRVVAGYDLPEDYDQDIYRHRHKATILGRYIDKATKAWEKEMQPLREAHWQVYNAHRGLHNRYDIFRLLFAMWHKGQTVVNPNPYRMLEEVYKWHLGRKEEKYQRKDFPVLAIHDTLDYWTFQKSPVLIDSYDMTCYLGKNKIQFGTEKIGEYERFVWDSEILPLAKDSRKDIRPYSREDVGLE